MDEDMDDVDAPQGEVNSPKSMRSQRQVPDETNSAFGLQEGTGTPSVPIEASN